MDPNTSGGPIPRNGPPVNNQMRPPPSPGNSSSNLNVRPQFPNQRPPSQQQQQLQPPMQNAAPGGRSPILSPFQKQDSGAGQQHSPNTPNFRPIQQQQQQQPQQHGGPSPVRPPNASPGSAPVQRPPMQQHQQQPRPNAPLPTGQQPNHFSPPGRPMSGVINPGSQSQIRPGAGSPQTPSTQLMRPPMQGGQPQQQPLQAHHPSGGPNLRPSASHTNLSGGATPTATAAGNRFTPPSPSLATRSPQIRPLQASPQNHGNQGTTHLPQQQQQQQQQQHHQAIRPSMSQTHLVQQPGARPPPAHGSPVPAHQATSVRPPHPTIQQQPRPRPPQAAPQGQSIPQQSIPGHVIQLDIYSSSDSQTNGGQDLVGAHQNQQHQNQQPQQRPPGARPIFDQMRQQVSQNQPGHSSSQVQGHSPQNMNPTQRQPQRPPAPPQVQQTRQQSPSVPHQLRDHAPSPSANEQNAVEGELQPTDVKTSNGLGGPSPRQQHRPPSNQRMPHSQQSPGAGAGHQQHHSPPGPALQSPPPRPYAVPGSPGQKQLGATEVKVLGSTVGASPQPRPTPQQQYNNLPQQQQQQQQQQLAELESIQLREPDAPLSDMDDDAVDDDDIEGGSKPPGNTSGAQATTDRSSQPQAAPIGGPPSGPPPSGPPRGPPRKLSGATGSTGPVRIMPPSNNPSSPPPTAFPSAGQPRPRVRPPPGNKVLTPYRPPERPSQAPVMYNQSGQPALSQPFPQMNDKSSGDQPSATASIVPQGADSASSSVRPKEGGLQKRVFASSEKNASTPDATKASNVMAPPSPRLHNQKGPAILSVSGQKKASPSVMSSIKKWAIRGGLVYLGYTAVFSCTHNTTGIKGYYCKATNGLGGLAKPYIAPHYNAYIGPHVDRYVKPVTRQGHRIYLKVADPVVQGAVSVAGTVYKSTAKKHVDSVKDQVISILPYPFKPKSDVSKDKDQVSEAQQYEEQEPLAETNDASPQSSHVEESDDMQQAIDSEENAIESTKEKASEDLEEAADDKDAVLEHEIPAVEATQHQEEEEHAVESESSEEKTEAENHADGQTTEHISVEKDDHQIAQDTNAPEEVELKESEENESGENGQNTLFKREEVEEPTDIGSEHKPSPEPTASVELESEPTLTATDEQPSAPSKEQEFTTQVEDFQNSPAVETVESTPEFADHPTEVPHEEEKAHTETEHAANVAETVFQPYETPAEEANNGNAAETTQGVEESQDEIHQQATENSFIDEQDQKGEHASEEKEEEKEGEKEEEKEEEKKEEHEEEHQGQMQEEGIDSTPGQQAAPVSETEHEDHPKAHDEL